MSRIILLVGFGGALGSISRYMAQQLTARYVLSAFPYGTFAVNVLGCLLIGVIYGLSARTGWLSPEWRIFLATGFCGGFTTFSTFSYEGVMLMNDGEYLSLAAYITLSVVVGMLATIGGIVLTKLI